MWSKRNLVEVFRKFEELSRGALVLLLPPTCGGCGSRIESPAALCGECDRRLERIEMCACQLCQQIPPRPGGDFCANCETERSPLRACLAAFRFEGESAEWIHRFKYPKRGLGGLDPAPASVVGAMLSESARRATGSRPDLVVPIPLHPRRLRSRGFNPAAELGRSLARECEIPFDAVALSRTRDTPSQTGLDRPARRRNVRGAFRSRPGRHIPERIWLVDDVVTTTSTLTEAALALRAAGARAVVGLCAARALSNVPCENHQGAAQRGIP